MYVCSLLDYSHGSLSKVTVHMINSYILMYHACTHISETDFRHIYSLDMSIPSKDCPSTLQLRVGDNLRLCGKKTNGASCDSVTIPTNGQSYSKVLGRVKAYQFGSPDGFNNIQNLDSYYVDGISITYGSPRKHVWTYAASYRQFIPNSPHGSLCPSTGSGTGPWSFVGDNYFCSSGNPGPGWSAKLYSQYPLWSNIQGKCSFCGKNVLSFCVELEASTSDDLELRVCTNERLDNEDIRIETIDFYVAS